MAKAKTQSKKKAAKPQPKKTPTKKASTKTSKSDSKKKNAGGRPLFDGKDKAVVLAKLKVAFEAGMNRTLACKEAGISLDALRRYIEKDEGFREYIVELEQFALYESTMVLNCGLREFEKTESLYTRDGEKIKFTPTNRAISIAKYNKRALDNRYALKQGDTPPPPPSNGGLTEDRKAEIVQALLNRKQPDPEPYEAK